MAIAPSDLHFRFIHNGGNVANGVLGNLFPDGVVNGSTTYAFVEVHNRNATNSLTSGKAWLSLDTGGAAVAIAVADGTARSEPSAYAPLDPAGLTYSTPTTQATGLTLPTLVPGQKVLLAIRRTLTGATAASPETNRLNVAGTSPL